MNTYLIIPGLGNSGPQHWQSYFERSSPDFHRVIQDNWESPDCQEWINRLDQYVQRFDPSDLIMIGHSLGCTTIVQWFAKYQQPVKAALLVAPSDPESPRYNFPATGFSPVPLDRLPFRSIVVASSNDEWVTTQRAHFFAENWGSEFIELPNAGHINVQSGYTNWDQGLDLLKKLG